MFRLIWIAVALGFLVGCGGSTSESREYKALKLMELQKQSRESLAKIAERGRDRKRYEAKLEEAREKGRSTSLIEGIKETNETLLKLEVERYRRIQDQIRKLE